MNAAQLAAATALYRALGNMPCRCTHNVPYAGGHVPQIVITQCSRCAALAQWEAAVNDSSTAKPMEVTAP